MGVHPEMSLFELELRHQEALEYKAQQNKLEMEEDAAKNWWQTLFLEELTACFHEYYKLKTLTYAGQRERVHKFFGEHLSHEQCVALCARKDFIKRLGGVRNAARRLVLRPGRLSAPAVSLGQFHPQRATQ